MKPAAIAPEGLHNRTAGDLVHEMLRARILGHELSFGTPLREDEVAGWFSTSRVPAREALRRLEQEGLVERVGRRYAVRSFDYDAVVIIYRQRAALEHLAVELAVERLHTGDPDHVLAPLRANIAAQQTAIAHATRAQFSDLDKEFHLEIARISGQAMLVQELDLILNRVQLIRTAEIARDAGTRGAHADHCRILAAIERGHAATAKAELDFHYMTTVRLHHPVQRITSQQQE